MSRCRTLCVGLLLAVFALPVAHGGCSPHHLRRTRSAPGDARDRRPRPAGLPDEGRDQDHGRRPVRAGHDEPRPPLGAQVHAARSTAGDARGRRDAARPGRTGRGGAAEHGRRAARRRADRRTPRWGPTGWRSRRPARRPRSSAVIAAANEIVGKPYKYGGGHGDWDDSGYDCSGSESYALHGAGLVSRAAELHGVHVLGRGGPGSVDHQLRQQRALLPRGRRPAVRHRLQRRAAAARSGAPRCARRTATPSATPQGSSPLVVLAIAHDGPFDDGGPSAAARVARKKRDQQADHADDHQDDPDGRDLDAGDVASTAK